MKTHEIPKLLDYIDGLWDHRKLSEVLRELLTEELAGLAAIPFDEACSELRKLRLGTGAFAPVEKIVEGLRLRNRQVAAGVAAQDAGLAANRLPIAPPEDPAANDAELRRWLEQRSDEELAHLADRCLRRQGSEARWIRMVKGVENFTRDDFGKFLAVCVALRSEWAGEFDHIPLGDERAKPIDAPVDFRTGVVA